MRSRTLLILVVLDFAQALLFERFFLLAALALGDAGLFFPSRALSRDFGGQPLALQGVVVHHLIERGSGHVDLVEALQLALLAGDRFAYGGEAIDLLDELGGDAGQCPRHLQTQGGDVLHHSLDGYSVDGLTHLGFVDGGGLSGLGVRGLVRSLDLGLYVLELLEHFGFRLTLPRGGLGGFGWHADLLSRSIA